MQKIDTTIDYLLSSYDYDLPPDLIAIRPLKNRDECRLLVYNQSKDEIIHTQFSNLPNYLEAGDLLVLNQSKVFPARLRGQKSTGGKVELMLFNQESVQVEGKKCYEVLLGSNSRKNINDQFSFLDGKLKATLVATHDSGQNGGTPTFFVQFNCQDPLPFFISHGQVPIPHYIRQGVADNNDQQDYQTVFSSEKKEHMKSMAAPTAGLHFTPDLLAKLNHSGIPHAKVTLHVGLGTFLPVKSENILDHQMHHEHYLVEDEELATIADHSKNLIAVGTTSLRALEDLYRSNNFSFPSKCPLRSTNIFLYPGEKVESIKGLITNFHLPKSTLLMLVSSLVGREKCLQLYQEAINHKYRFYSYGDAMLILRKR